MIKQITSQLRTLLRMTATGFMISLLSTTVPLATSVVKAQTQLKANAAPGGGGQKEGIKVHGHWMIDVRNPNGTLMKHHEFENALVPGPVLASLLGRTKIMGTWRIILSWPGGKEPCNTRIGSAMEPTPCLIIEPNLSVNVGAPDYVFTNLKVSAPGNSLILSGFATVGADTFIKQVGTAVSACSTDTPVSVCTGGYLPLFDFTSATLTEPVNGLCPPNTPCAVHVSHGQIVQVTVTISFS